MKKSIFILGDSICIYYSPYLIPLLENDYTCITKKGRAEAMVNLDVPVKANAGSTKNILSFFSLEEKHGNFSYDYLLFNSGMHDLVYLVDKETGELKKESSVLIPQYMENLNTIIDLMHSHTIKPIFITTTPVDDERHKMVSFRRYNADVLKYNEAAKTVMAERNIPVIDLYDFTDKLDGEKYRDHVHYLEEVAEKQAHFINIELRKILETY